MCSENGDLTQLSLNSSGVGIANQLPLSGNAQMMNVAKPFGVPVTHTLASALESRSRKHLVTKATGVGIIR